MIIKAKVGNKTLRVKDCRGVLSIKGLMFNPLKDIDGALIYANSVWMPFVKELDLLFLGEDFKVIGVKHAVPITANPETWKTYSGKNAKYCLEVKRGLIKAKPGMKIKIF